jgi:hypothetical protein
MKVFMLNHTGPWEGSISSYAYGTQVSATHMAVATYRELCYFDAACAQKALQACNEVCEGYYGQPFISRGEYRSPPQRTDPTLTLRAVSTLKRYSKALEYKYRVKTAALSTLK